MNLEAIYGPFEDFQARCRDSGAETAVIRLQPGDGEGTGWCSHADCQQMVLVLEGEIKAEIGGDERIVGKGGTLVIGEGMPYKLTNPGGQTALGFAVYAPRMLSPRVS